MKSSPSPKPGKKTRKPGRIITRAKLMRVLDRVLEGGGYKITVRSYNEILTGCGFRLGNYTKAAKENPL